jgi:hypothetical protein
MGCLRAQNFINGTKFNLPRLNLDQSAGQEVWDRLRPLHSHASENGRHAQCACLAGRRVNDTNPSKKREP